LSNSNQTPGIPPGTRRYNKIAISRMGTADDFKSVHPGALADLVRKIVLCEGPIHLDLVKERIAQFWAISRVGHLISGHMDQAIRYGLRNKQFIKKSDFLWPPGCEAAPVRIAAENEIFRAIEHICIEEIIQAAYLCVKDAFSLSEDDLITQTARLLGYGRTGQNVRTRIEEAVKEGIHAGILTVKGQKITIPRQVKPVRADLAPPDKPPPKAPGAVSTPPKRHRVPPAKPGLVKPREPRPVQPVLPLSEESRRSSSELRLAICLSVVAVVAGILWFLSKERATPQQRRSRASVSAGVRSVENHLAAPVPTPLKESTARGNKVEAHLPESVIVAAAASPSPSPTRRQTSSPKATPTVHKMIKEVTTAPSPTAKPSPPTPESRWMSPEDRVLRLVTVTGETVGEYLERLKSEDSSEGMGKMEITEVETLLAHDRDYFQVFSQARAESRQRGLYADRYFRWNVWPDRIEVGSVSAMLLTPEYTPIDDRANRQPLLFHQGFLNLIGNLSADVREHIEYSGLDDYSFQPRIVLKESIKSIPPDIQLNTWSTLAANVREVSKATFGNLVEHSSKMAVEMKAASEASRQLKVEVLISKWDFPLSYLDFKSGGEAIHGHGWKELGYAVPASPVPKRQGEKAKSHPGAWY